jgi:hypothetical protein
MFSQSYGWRRPQAMNTLRTGQVFRTSLRERARITSIVDGMLTITYLDRDKVEKITAAAAQALLASGEWKLTTHSLEVPPDHPT